MSPHQRKTSPGLLWRCVFADRGRLTRPRLQHHSGSRYAALGPQCLQQGGSSEETTSWTRETEKVHTHTHTHTHTHSPSHTA